MIKYETIIRNIQVKIEKERYDVQLKLDALDKENENSPLSKGRSLWYSHGFSSLHCKYVEGIESSSSDTSYNIDSDDEFF